MANSVTFPVSLGGDGQTYTDDSNQNTGMGNGGHRLRFIPALSGAVAMAASSRSDADACQAFRDETQDLRDTAATSQANAAASEAAAAGSASAASTSESNAAASEAAAAGSASAASTSESNAAASEAAASASESKAKASETASSASETAAAASASNAAASETSAANSASAAAASESNAATHETNADAALRSAYEIYSGIAAIDQAVNDSENSAQLAGVKASQSSTSASDAASSASEAATSAASAASSEAAAASSEAGADTSETWAEKWAQEPYNTQVKTGQYSSLHHATVADNHRTAALQSAVDASNARTGAETAESNASASETAAAASESAAATSESNAKASETAAANSETAAALSESNAADSETAAKNSENAAATSESNAASSASAASLSESNAADSESAAALSEGSAASSASDAASSEALAQAWATQTTSPVSGNLYGAKYYADKARAEITGTLIYRGTWDATTALPADPKIGDLYKVNVASGQYNVGDQIIYNSTGWDHVDNTEQVTSVGGNVGDITDTQLREAVKRVDGPGSGLNADTLDGLQASDFLRVTGGTVKGLLNLYATSNNEDEDLLRLGDRDSGYGFYFRYIGTGTGNNNKLEFWTDGATGDDVLSYQVAQDGVVEFDSTPTVSGNTVYHAGNDGSGSGLDADKLDGQHASAFFPKSGGVVDGKTLFAGSGHHNSQSPNIAVALGDADTGLEWVADGHFQLWANATPIVDVTKGEVDSYYPLKENGNQVWHAGNVPATATRWPKWSEITSKPGAFTPAAHNHSADEITSGVLAYARIPTIRAQDTNFANQYLNTGSSVQHAKVRTGGTADDGVNSLQVQGGTRTDTLASGSVQAPEESIETDGNVKVHGEGQLKMGDFAIQYNAATQSLDFNFLG